MNCYYNKMVVLLIRQFEGNNDFFFCHSFFYEIWFCWQYFCFSRCSTAKYDICLKITEIKSRISVRPTELGVPFIVAIGNYLVLIKNDELIRVGLASSNFPIVAQFC